jgi:hypothetical protein
MRIFTTRWLAVLFLIGSVFTLSISGQTSPPADSTATTKPAVDDNSVAGTETIVFLRHGEKPAKGLGQLTPQGFNRAIALSTLLPAKFGKPDFLFAPDPAQKVGDAGGSFNYVRPLATIEPTAIALGMPVQTPFGFSEINKLNAELTEPKYAKATIFVAWEHGYEQKAVANLVKQFGGDGAQVPRWAGADFDSLYVVTITRAAGQPATVTFRHDHEDLDHLSTSMPVVGKPT